ncbi:MAG: hypothetical protein U0237_15050 [Thermoleophilia bacterium]
MTIVIVGLLALIGLVVVGLFLPVLLIPAVIIAVIWVVFAIRSARAAGDPGSV